MAFQPDEVPGIGSPLADLSQKLGAVLGGLQWTSQVNGQTLCVEFQLVRHPDIGAFVFSHKDTVYIVFHHLLFSVLLDLFNRIVDHLPLQDYDEELVNGPQMPLEQLVQDETVIEDQSLDLDVTAATLGLASYYPRSHERLSLAVKLQVLALEFLFWHEINHLICGHLGFYEKAGDLSVIEEGRPPIADSSASQAMEYMADLFTAVSFVEMIKSRRFVLIPPEVFGQTTDSNRTLIYGLTIAVTTLFALFHSHEQQDHGDRALVDPNYPTVFTRYVTVVDMLTRGLDGWSDQSSQQWAKTASQALQDLRVATRSAGLDPVFLHQIESDELLDQARLEMVILAETAIALQMEWNRNGVMCE